jgi:hypothetical protein
MHRARKLPLIAAVFIGFLPVSGRSDPPRCPEAKATLLASGLQGPFGITVGPDRALYVTESITGSISRVDPNTGATTLFASGLPTRGGLFSGPVDIAFIGNTAYVLVTLVSADVGGPGKIDGIYRVDGPNTFTVVADIGDWNIAHPNEFKEAPTGVLYSLEKFRDGFVVSDGNADRVLQVTLDHSANFDPRTTSNIKELILLPNDPTPTGLLVSGDTIYVAEAGQVPQTPEAGAKIAAFNPNTGNLSTVASGAPFLLDVAFGRGRDLYAVSMGHWSCCHPGDPADPFTGSLVKLEDNGGFTVIADHLDRPVSLQFIGNTAYFVSFDGGVWEIEDVSCRRDDNAR